MTKSLGFKRGDDTTKLSSREWLVTNGIGGYASGTLGGAPARRFHGLLISALPAPLGRVMMLNHLDESLVTPGGRVVPLTALDRAEAEHLVEVRLEHGLPVWRFDVEGIQIERRVVMPHGQNTTLVIYRAWVPTGGKVTLRLRPWIQIRLHEARVDSEHGPYAFRAAGSRWEIGTESDLPPLRLQAMHSHGDAAIVLDGERRHSVQLEIERARGYDSEGTLYGFGYIEVDVAHCGTASLVASTEDWDTALALDPEEALAAEHDRRRRLLHQADPMAREGLGACLVLAADQFIIAPQTRPADAVRARARGDAACTVIAGYHWFTDWGRDTMISLEGLTLVTGRTIEAGCILRTFAHHVKDGLIPNMFPEGKMDGLYHTADATLWFFHAVERYVAATGDQPTRRAFYPTLRSILQKHVQGTRFGIRVDPADGLLTQGEAGYQLTWMDAKVGDWVVTPRRGKAVEINALFYNALRLLAGWATEDGDRDTEVWANKLADRVRTSFNARFWNDDTQCLYDVIDGERGDDPALRPNQLLAISLTHAVLDSARWRPVLEAVERELLTPVGLRSLAPHHADYKQRYDGDLRARDAAYHQGTIWGWLVGPWVDARLRVFPGDVEGASRALAGIEAHMNDASIGTISEIFDAETPYSPRGCAAQAWSVAEALRAIVAIGRAKANASRDVAR